MNELIERFLQYIYRRNSQSEKTVDAYKRDLTQFKEYLESQGITNFEDFDGAKSFTGWNIGEKFNDCS